MANGPRLVFDASSQPHYAGAKPNEIATLVVGGRYYSDWETVWVSHHWPDPMTYFRFTAAERDPSQPILEATSCWSARMVRV